MFKFILSKIGVDSLKNRLHTGFFTLLVILILLGSLPIFLIGKNQPLKSAEKEMLKVINLQQDVIDKWLAEKVADINIISQLPSVKTGNIKEINQTLAIFSKGHYEFNNFTYVNKDGVVKLNSFGNEGTIIVNEECFKKSMKGENFISDIVFTEQSKEPFIFISSPTYDDNNKINGIIYGSVPIDNINDIMIKFQDNSKETFLIDRNNRLITKNSSNNVGDKVTINTKANKADQVNKLSLVVNDSGDEVYQAEKSVFNNNWRIIAEVKKSSLYEPLHKMATIYLIEIIILIIIGFTIVSQLSNELVTSVNRVLFATRKIGSGNLSYRLNENDANYETNEFKELELNFNNMAQLIDDSVTSLVKSKELYRMITEYSTDIITILDISGTIVFVSPASNSVLLYDDDEIIGKSGFELIHPGDVTNVKEDFQAAITKGDSVSIYRIKQKDGRYLNFESSIKYLMNDNSSKYNILVISRNITERKLTEQKLQESNELLRELSMKDGLLEIWNRRAFDEHLNIEWRRSLRDKTPISLIMLDIDNFKAFNDNYGHLAGDNCLKKVAKVITSSLKRASDSCFRYGGEEFSVILPNTDEQGALTVAKTIQTAITEQRIPHESSTVAPFITISAGVNTLYPSEENSTARLIDGSDRALYMAKEQGRNKIVRYTN